MSGTHGSGSHGRHSHSTRRWRPAIRRADWTPPATPVLVRRWLTRMDRKESMIDVVSAVLLRRGWVAEVDRPWLLLCLDETLTNAMMHGNEGDPRLHIQVRAAADERRWYLGIDDEGTGFAADQIPDPENPGSATLEHGRGIVMMRSWLDGLMYYRGGRTAVMSRRRADRGE